MPNVLVFESDAAFANELKGELESRGCAVTVVDDASVGLQTAAADKPDLILLTIELPRMNGFSVCNKLKRDPALKEVPLIIMSSDSTEETFEQHRRLRTHAEDYVHKPIAFTDLLARITVHVPIGGDTSAPAGDEDIVIDDDVDIEEEAAPAESEAVPSSQVDEEVDAFTESAFGNMMDEPKAAEAPSPAPAPASIPPMSEAPAPEPEAPAESIQALSEPPSSLDALDLEAQSLPPARVSEPPPPEPVMTRSVVPRHTSIPPRPLTQSIDQSIKDDLAKTTERARELEKELREAKNKIADLEDAAGRAAAKDSEVQRLQRELDDVKAKASVGTKGGGSAREFLDLRETLNKKEKEVLDLRDEVTRREKDLLNLKDTNLASEREKADLSDRIVDLEKAASDLGRQIEAAKADKDQAAKRAEDFKRKGEKLQGELDARNAELTDSRRKYEEDIALRDAAEAALRAEHQEALEQSEAEKQSGIEAAAAAATEQATAAGEAAKQQALARAREEHEKSRAQAITTREGELKKEHDSKLAALHRANEDAMNRLKAEHGQVLSEAEKRAADRLAELERNHASARESLVAEHTSALELAKDELSRTAAALSIMENAKAESEASRDARIAALESDLSDRAQSLDSANSRLEEREASLAATEANLAATRQELLEARTSSDAEQAKVKKAHSKWNEDRASIERAKDALAAALAQLDEIEARPVE